MLKYKYLDYSPATRATFYIGINVHDNASMLIRRDNFPHLSLMLEVLINFALQDLAKEGSYTDRTIVIDV